MDAALGEALTLSAMAVVLAVLGVRQARRGDRPRAVVSAVMVAVCGFLAAVAFSGHAITGL